MAAPCIFPDTFTRITNGTPASPVPFPERTLQSFFAAGALTVPLRYSARASSRGALAPSSPEGTDLRSFGGMNMNDKRKRNVLSLVIVHLACRSYV
jgi:hypothetical protein